MNKSKFEKILVIHTNYRDRGGEDIAVDEEVQFLSKFYNVDTLFFSNKFKNRIVQSLFLFLNYNFISLRELNKKIGIFKPDICYVHNTWFEGSPAIIRFLNKKGIKTIIKVHNSRLNCCNSYLVKNHIDKHEFCNGCGQRRKKYQLLNKTFGDSYLKSFLVVRHIKKLLSYLILYKTTVLALGEFQKNQLGRIGLNRDNIHIFHNYIKKQTIQKETNTTDYFVYAGRVSAEKGVKELIEAFLDCKFKNLNLYIVGDGPQLNDLKNYYDLPNIVFLGSKNRNDTLKIIGNSKGLLTFTKMHEGQPTVLCEASMLSIPSVFPEAGSISSFFPPNYPYIFEQGDKDDFKKKLMELNNSKDLLNVGLDNKDFILGLLKEETLSIKFKKIVSN
tara:strand:- start:2061 stop:3224 length:1164 start_codon:yes stop_codon:yes gene_type:complete